MSFSYSNGVITQSNEASKNITAFSNGGTNILTISVSAHGYSVGNLVEIKNTSNYNGVYLITSKTTNTFNVSTFTVDDIENSFVATDTGTVERGDADNSGLFGLTDVDRDDSETKYTISNSVIEIEGAWLLDPEVNELIFSDTYTSPFCLITRKAGCFFQIGTKKKDNNNVSYSKGSAITTTSVFNNPTATFNLIKYGLMQSESSITSRFRAFGGVINTTLNVAIAGSNSNFNSLADVNIESLTINNIIMIPPPPPNVPNYFLRLVALYFNDSTSNISNLNMVVTGVRNYLDIRNDRGLSNATFTLERANINTDFQSQAPKTFINCVFGKNLNAFGTRLRVSSNGADFYDIYTNIDIGSSVVTDPAVNNRKGQYITRQILNITSKDVNKNNVNAKFYLSDNVGANPSSTASNPATINFNNQFSYTATASSGFVSLNIITSFVKKLSNLPPVTHYRSNSDTSSDDYTIYGYEYGKLPLALPLVAKGTNGTDISASFSQDQAISQPSKTIVDAYPISILIVSNTITVIGDNTTIQNLTSTQLYDVLASYLEDNHGTYTQFLVTISGNEINANGYNVDLSYINYTGDMVTDQVITLSNGSIFNGTRTDQNGTVLPFLPVTGINIVQGSRVKLFNVTKSITLDNSVVTGTGGYSTTVDPNLTTVDIGDTLRLEAAYQNGATAKKQLALFAVLTSSGLSFIDSQEDLTDYASLGVDGSTVTEYNLDTNTGHLQIDAFDADCQSLKKRIVARYYYLITTEIGIDRLFGRIVLEDSANAVIKRSVEGGALMIDNVGNCQIELTDNDFRLYTDDGSSWILSPSTGGYGFTVDSGRVNIAKQAEVENKLQKLVDSEEADIFVTPTRFTKKIAGTETVILEKTYTTDGQGTESLTEVT